MKFTIYNKSNVPLTRNRKPTITFDHHGLITLNSGLVSLLGLDSTKKIEIIQNEESVKDWYLSLSDDRHGFYLREKKFNNYSFNCSFISKKIKLSLGLSLNENYKFIVSKNPIEHDNKKLFLIITSSIYANYYDQVKSKK